MKDWQVYELSGRQVSGTGTSHEQAFAQGIPHGAAHVWIWKEEAGQIYLLFQKCASKVSYKAGLLDISAAGHVDIGENEIEAAIRETDEELGVKLDVKDLYYAGIEHYQYRTAESHKDEFSFVYTVKFAEHMQFTLPDGEVDGVEWIKAGKTDDILSRGDFSEKFVQHTAHYFNIVFSGIDGHRLVLSS